MRSRFWSRTQFSTAAEVGRLVRGGGDASAEKGSLMIWVVFLFLVFSGLCLGMIMMAQVHLNIGRCRKESVMLDYAAENGVKKGFSELAGFAGGALGLVPLTSGKLDALRAQPAGAFNTVIEGVLGIDSGWEWSESAGSMSWQSRVDWAAAAVEDRGEFIRLEAGFSIRSAGRTATLKQERVSFLEGTLGLIAGRLPLASLPFVIGRKLDGAEKGLYLDANNISVIKPEGGGQAPEIIAGESGVIPEDATGLLAQALRIKLFRPQDLTAARLRRLLGLPDSDEPVPDGVYLIKDDLGLGAVFVQGDLEEMIPAVDRGWQLICFRRDGQEWLLRYSPTEERTEFRTPESTSCFDLVPTGVVIVNGRIGALGGGTVGPDGRVAMERERETACVHDGVRLSIIASDKVTISSHLILEGVKWQDAIPYVKGSQAQLIIYAAGYDLVSGEAREGAVTTSEDAPETLKVQAALTAARGGFEVKGRGVKVEVAGSIQAADYEGHGNSLSVVADPRWSEAESSDGLPLTQAAFLAACKLRPLNWKEY